RAEVSIVGYERAAVADAGEVLRREEAEGGRVTQRACPPAVPGRPRGLRRVLDHGGPELLQLLDWRDVAEQVNGHDRLRLRRQRALDRRDRDAERCRVDVAEDRPRA